MAETSKADPSRAVLIKGWESASSYKITIYRKHYTSIQVTLDTYSHVAPGIQEKAAARLDDIFKTERRNDPVETVG